MISRTIKVTVTAAIVAGGIAIQSVPASACTDDGNDTLKLCLAKQYGALEARLKDLSQRALDKSRASAGAWANPKDWQRSFIGAQQKWTAARTADCDVLVRHEQANTPEMIGIEQMRCMIEHTQARIGALQRRYRLE